MNYCRACGKTVHETAASCPHCGAVRRVIKPAVLTTHGNGPIWTSITGMVFGILPVVASFQPKDWNKDEAVGLGLFAVVALVFGSISLAHRHRGRGIAIAAVVLGAIGLMAAIGSQN